MKALLLLWAVWMLAPAVFAQSAPSSWRYQLLEGSALLDDCPVCDRIPISYPMTGSFDLVLRDSNPIFTYYDIRNLEFSAGLMDERLTVKGSGSYEIGGHLVLRQEMSLEATLAGQSHRFTNQSSQVERVWPILEISLVQTQESSTQVFHLHIVAAPLHDIWFSTRHGFTSGASTNHGTAGDVLSSAGRIVKPRSGILSDLGIVSRSDLGLDAVHLMPGGEHFISLDSDAFSAEFGTLQEGDLLSDKSGVVLRNQDLTAAFAIQPLAPDAGLDALSIEADGEILFSIRMDIFSEALGAMLRHGDVLSNRGRVVKSNQQLLAPLQPVDEKRDYGLDALYVWPHGEIWFSTSEDLESKTLGAIGHGDLLSDQGFVVARNLSLLAAFAPLEELASFGLESVFVITDSAASTPGPRFTEVLARDNDIVLRWTGPGRVFQIEKSSAVTGPYLPFSPIVPALTWLDSGALTNGLPGYYRLRQW
jgi:hypothetical protein